jgi:hypothetical protein
MAATPLLFNILGSMFLSAAYCGFGFAVNYFEAAGLRGGINAV